MNLEKLTSITEDERHLEIIEISKSANPDAINYLLDSYWSETYENIGGSAVEAELLTLLSTEEGIILGDICKSIGLLGLSSSKEKIATLQEHELPWIRQNANWALKNLVRIS